MSKEIIVIIGPPGSGKTTLINRLLERGYICYPEISRQITQEAQKKGIDQLFLKDPLLFSEMLLEARIKQFEDASKESSNIIFIDRGIPDILAYMNYIGDDSSITTFEEACKKYTYSNIFILPPWDAIYKKDDVRYENYEQAQEIHLYIEKTYIDFGYNLIEVPKVSIDDRVEFILNEIQK